MEVAQAMFKNKTPTLKNLTVEVLIRIRTNMKLEL